MQAPKTTPAHIVSWVLFVVALAVAMVWSFLLLSAEATFGMTQVVAAGPWAVALVIYLVTMPVTYGMLGLFRSSARRRFIAAGAIGLTVLVFMFVAMRV